MTTDYKGLAEATGSDKHFSFALVADDRPVRVHVFEAAIDAMSYASLKSCITKTGENRVSVAGRRVRE